jgi:hypothetical protein
VDVLACRATLQPHEAPVGEELHRLVVVVRRRHTIAGLLREQSRCSLAGRLRLGATARRRSWGI